MDYYAYICIFILGTLIGSFLNVVILRFNTGIRITTGRSRCFSCGKGLSWYELVPLFSFFLLRGKCHGCKSHISWQYPLVEFLSGCSFLVSYTLASKIPQPSFLIAFFVLYAAILSTYIIICVYDIRHKIIPDAFSFGAIFLALLVVATDYGMTGFFDPYRFLGGFCLFSFFFFFWFISRGTWMGFGDAKLAISVGLILGLERGIAATLFAFWIGAVLSILIILLQKFRMRRGGLSFKSEIPFGPYILVGFFIVFVWGIDIQSILSFLAV